MRINNNLYAQNNEALNQVKKLEKLSSGNNVNTNQTDVGQSGINSRKITIQGFKTVSNSNNIQETNKNNSVQNTNNEKTSFTIEATKTVTNDNNINETKQNNSAQQIDNTQTSSGTKINNNRQITTSISNISSISDGRSQLQMSYMNLSSINNYVDTLKSFAEYSASDNAPSEFREMLNVDFNNFKQMIDDEAKRFGAVDSKDKNNINFSYGSTAEDGSNKESSVNISFAATVKGLGLDKIDISSKESAMKAIESLTNASSSIKSSMDEIGKSVTQVNKDFHTELDSMFKRSFTRIEADHDLDLDSGKGIKSEVLQQAGVAALAQSNSAPNAVLSLLR